jgi:hypothetical protein
MNDSVAATADPASWRWRAGDSPARSDLHDRPRAAPSGPTTEEQLRAAWVTEPPRLTGRIQVVDYDPGWPRLLRREAERIRAALEERARDQRVKRELAERDWTYVQEYADATTEVVEGIIARARGGPGGLSGDPGPGPGLPQASLGRSQLLHDGTAASGTTESNAVNEEEQCDGRWWWGRRFWPSWP